jgi:hypothetical protein
MTTTGKFSVVDILDKTHVVLNVGSDQGILLDDQLVVFSNDREIKDIDGRSLGFLELVKGYGSISHVQERVSILKADVVRGFQADIDNYASSSLGRTLGFQSVVDVLSSVSSFLLVERGDLARKV